MWINDTFTGRLGRGALAGVAAGMLALAGTGCSATDGTAGAGTTPTDPASATPAGGVGALGGAGAPTGAGGQGQPGSGTGTGSTVQAGPRIVWFRIKQQASCPQGTNLHTVPARPLIIEWKVSGADQAELAVDGPGRYNAYATQGSETFTFSCGGAPGTVERHTYTLTTVGGGQARSKTITASARVNEIAVVDGPTPAAA